MIRPAYGLALDSNATTIDSLARVYQNWQGVLTNHVVNQLGHFKGDDESSRSISTNEDRLLLLALRKFADLIIVDASTARLERYRTPSSGAKLAILSKSGNFNAIPAVSDANQKPWLISALESTTQPMDTDSAGIDYSADPIGEVIARARQRGLNAILWEAGPTLTKLVFERGLVQKSALTITPELVDLDRVQNSHPFDSTADLISVAHSDGASFSYWSH